MIREWQLSPHFDTWASSLKRDFRGIPIIKLSWRSLNCVCFNSRRWSLPLFPRYFFGYFIHLSCRVFYPLSVFTTVWRTWEDKLLSCFVHLTKNHCDCQSDDRLTLSEIIRDDCMSYQQIFTTCIRQPVLCNCKQDCRWGLPLIWPSDFYCVHMIVDRIEA